MIAFTVVLIYIFSTFLISLFFKKYFSDNKEVLRKIIHIGIGPLIPLAQFLKIDERSALIFTGIVTIMILLNYFFKIFPTIEDVDRKSFGTFFYCLSLFILISIFWDKDPYALTAGVFIMAFGDGLAGLVGKSFNSKNWILFQQKKSLLGTLTMFLISLIVVLCLGYAQQNSLNISFLAIAFFATLLEQFSILGIDNFIVPISSAFCFNIFSTS